MAAMSAVVLRPGPATNSGRARIAPATRPSGRSPGAVPMWRYARAKPGRLRTKTGAPHPSTPVPLGASPQSSSTVVRICT